MNSLVIESVAIFAATAAILMVGTGHLKINLLLYFTQTISLALLTALMSRNDHGSTDYTIALCLMAAKSVGLPLLLMAIIKKIDVPTDRGAFVAIPVSMHLSIALLAVSFLLAKQLPQVSATPCVGCSAAAISMLLSGLLFMLTRRLAVSQIIGFLTMENGIYLFGQSETTGMPPIVEMGIFLDILVGVMIAGLVAFRIKQSFEHIDITQLADLKDN